MGGDAAWSLGNLIDTVRAPLFPFSLGLSIVKQIERFFWGCAIHLKPSELDAD